MSTHADIEALKKLNESEKLNIIYALWDSIGEPAELGLSEEQLGEMQRRLERARANPDESMTLEEFKARARELA